MINPEPLLPFEAYGETEALEAIDISYAIYNVVRVHIVSK